MELINQFWAGLASAAPTNFAILRSPTTLRTVPAPILTYTPRTLRLYCPSRLRGPVPAGTVLARPLASGLVWLVIWAGTPVLAFRLGRVSWSGNANLVSVFVRSYTAREGRRGSPRPHPGREGAGHARSSWSRARPTLSV